MKYVALVGSIVIFVIVAILAFFMNEADVSIRTLIGLTAVGFAALAVSLLPLPSNVA
jgi:hypothetical protein